MGQSIDMAALRQRNKNTRAVGNMNVNANGDTVDSENRVISDSTQRVNRVYNKTTVNPGAQTRRQQTIQPDVAPPVTAPDLSSHERAALDEFDSEEPVGKPTK
jgi:hypothetical protein